MERWLPELGSRGREKWAKRVQSEKETNERNNNSAQILPEIERKDKAFQFILKVGITLTKTEDTTIKLLTISHYYHGYKKHNKILACQIQQHMK